MPKTWTGFVEMRAVPKQRPRITKGRAYMDSSYMEARKAFGMMLRSLNPPKFDGPVSVRLAFMTDGVLIEIEEVDSKREKHVRADVDNLAGFVMETLEDRQIIKNDRDVHTLWVTVSKEA